MQTRYVRVGLVILGICAIGIAWSAHAQPPKVPDAEDILKHHVIIDDGSGRPPLPKIGVVPSISAALADVTLHTVVRRDLDLCGEFELLSDDKSPDDAVISSTVDVKAWKDLGAESVVKVTGRNLKDNKVELKGIAYFTDEGDDPVYDKTLIVHKDDVREESHRIADALIGALTGTDGAFASEMTFVYGVGKQRRAYVMGADGHNPTAVSNEDHLALGPAFDKDHGHYYAASVRRGAFKVYKRGKKKPLSLKPRGSVYGMAFNPRKREVAIAIARGATINMFRGPDLFNLKQASKIGMTLHPAWSPTGKLAFSGEGQLGVQQVYVDGRAVSPAGLHSSAPTFCRHPDGIKLVYMVGVGKNMDLVATGEKGGGMYRLTAGKGRNMYPACSPDGRLVAFFSTRRSGPGLYIMRLDGTRPKRVSTLVGDSLRWSRLPAKKK